MLQPLLPVIPQRGQPRLPSYRDLIDGILDVLRGGNPWRAMPHDLLPWQPVYRYVRAWTIDGTRTRIHDALMEADRERAERAPEPTAGVLDSQTVRTTERGDRGDEGAKRMGGRTRHLLVESDGRLLAVFGPDADLQDPDGG